MTVMFLGGSNQAAQISMTFENRLQNYSRKVQNRLKILISNENPRACYLPFALINSRSYLSQNLKMITQILFSVDYKKLSFFYIFASELIQRQQLSLSVGIRLYYFFHKNMYLQLTPQKTIRKITPYLSFSISSDSLCICGSESSGTSWQELSSGSVDVVLPFCRTSPPSSAGSEHVDGNRLDGTVDDWGTTRKEMFVRVSM